MAALRAVVYPPRREPGTRQAGQESPTEPRPGGTEATGGESSSATGRQARPEAGDVQKVVKQFSRLARNFERGMRDREYLSQVSAADLRVLFFVLTTYLRLLRVEGLVDRESFVRLSALLFGSFASEDGSTGWSAVPARADLEGSEIDEPETHHWEQAWLHLYLLADLCFGHERERLPELAVLLRRFARQVGPPTLLRELPEELLSTLWRRTIYPARGVRKAEDVVADLERYSGWYSERTLTRELRSTPLAQAYVGHDLIRQRSVPSLTVVEPWHDDRLDHYWEAFVNFMVWSDSWPEPRRNARLVVKDSNPRSDGHQSNPRLALFYRSDDLKLRIQVDADESGMYLGMVEGLSPSELASLKGFAAVIDHPSERTLSGSKPPVSRL